MLNESLISYLLTPDDKFVTKTLINNSIRYPQLL